MTIAKRVVNISILFLIASTLVLSINNFGMTGPVTASQKPTRTQHSIKSSFFDEKLSATGNLAFLPDTNLSVTEYLEGAKQHSYNASIQSLNITHWFVSCDYSRTQNWESQPINPSFDAIVNRTGFNHVFNATNYYNWQGYSQDTFDFWIDTTGFSNEYTYESGGITITVTEVSDFYLAGFENFHAWKISGTDPEMGSFSAWYDSTGLFLSLTFQVFLSTFWYNLTFAEISELPQDFTGPVVSYSLPSNNSLRPQGIDIELQFSSPYGISVVYYQWNGSTNITSQLPLIQTIFPAGDGPHDLYVTVVDNIEYSSFFHFVYITDNSIPGISLVSHKNNSKIQGSSEIQILITEGNGSFTYNWNDESNQTVAEETKVILSDPDVEGSHILNVFAMNDAGTWTKSLYLFIVDNTAPAILVENTVNGSIIKDSISVQVTVTELCDLIYSLNDSDNASFYAETGQNYTITFSNLANGSYQLNLYARDSANNTDLVVLTFSVYTSAFNWNWHITSQEPRSLNIVDASGEEWFKLILTSKTDQDFNLTVLSADEQPGPGPANQLFSAIEFICDKPEDIIFMTLVYTVNASLITNSTVAVYEWVYWDDQSGNWTGMTTSFNYLSYTWEATNEGSVTYFALIETGETLDLGLFTERPKRTSPSFGLFSAFSLFVLFLVAKKSNSWINKRKEV